MMAHLVARLPGRYLPRAMAGRSSLISQGFPSLGAVRAYRKDSSTTPERTNIENTRRPRYRGGYITRFASDDPIIRKRRWSDMDHKTRVRWKILGWDEKNWRTGHPTPWSEKYNFNDLGAVARGAAESLGYNEEAWENDDGDASEPRKGDSDDRRLVFGLAVAFIAFLIFERAMDQYQKYLQRRKVRCSEEDRIKLRSYISAVVQHDKSKHLTQEELKEGSESYLEKMQDLHCKLCDSSGMISRRSWEEACAKGRAHDTWSSHDDHHEHDIASMLFSAADLNLDEELSFVEFVALAVTAAAAHDGDVKAQADLLFMLIDTDHDGEISYGESMLFIFTIARTFKPVCPRSLLTTLVCRLF